VACVLETHGPLIEESAVRTRRRLPRPALYRNEVDHGRWHCARWRAGVCIQSRSAAGTTAAAATTAGAVTAVRVGGPGPAESATGATGGAAVPAARPVARGAERSGSLLEGRVLLRGRARGRSADADAQGSRRARRAAGRPGVDRPRA